MATKYPIPTLGEAFRALVTQSGLRPAIEDKGEDQNLDHVATEKRPGSHYQLLSVLEGLTHTLIQEDAGPAWAALSIRHWQSTKSLLQGLAQHVDTRGMAPEDGRGAFHKVFTSALIGDFLTEAEKHLPGPNLQRLLEKPFRTWMEWCGTSNDAIATTTGVEERTILRWREGLPIEGLRQERPTRDMPRRPLRKVVESLSQKQSPDHATGWLMVVIGLQSLEEAERLTIQRELNLDSDWRETREAIFADIAMASSGGTTTLVVAAIVRQIDEEFRLKPVNATKVRRLIDDLSDVLKKKTCTIAHYHQPSADRYRARIAVIQGNDALAIEHYGKAMEQLWWKAGSEQQHIFTEALALLGATGKRPEIKRYWDMAFMLGLNKPPFHEFGEQDGRKLSLAFEHIFSGRTSIKDRVMYGPEVVDRAFNLTKEMREFPNRKKKFNDEKTQRTPLMDAVLRGTVDHVIELLDCGGDVNVTIEETGDSALSYALKIAWQRKNSSILYAILNLTPRNGDAETRRNRIVTEKTAKQTFGMSWETSLKYAIDIADPLVAERLITCGAQLEVPCANAPSALFHALQAYFRSLHAEETSRASQALFLAGQGGVGAHDARTGAVTEADLARSRQARFLPLLRDEKDRRLLDQIISFHAVRPERLSAVISTLLRCGANPNLRYMDMEENWTPTLLAAAIGDLDVFKMLLSYGGDPDLTLSTLPAGEPQDALFAAQRRNNGEIVAYLKDLRSPPNPA